MGLEPREPVSEAGRYGDLRLDPDALTDDYQPVDGDENVKAKLWEGENGEQRVYLRIRDHDDGRRYNELSLPIEAAAERGGG
jgi:hypothetical protein